MYHFNLRSLSNYTQINKKRETELTSELNVSIQEQTLKINKVRRSLLENRLYENVIEFSRGRKR